MSDDLDFLNEMNSELQRLTTDPRNQNNFLKNFVAMPKQSGVVTVRILPPLEGNKYPYCTTRTHKLNNKNIHCPKVLQAGRWVGKCAICDYYNWLWKESDKNGSDAEALKAEARGIRPTERYYYNVIVRNNPETGQGESDGPLILSVGKIVHTKIILGICGNKEFGEEPLGKVWDFTTGRDFKIIKKIKPGGQYPEYSDSKFLNVSILSNDSALISQWMSSRHDIYALRKVLEEKDIKQALRIYKGLEQDPDTSFNPEEFLSNVEKPQTQSSSNLSQKLPESNHANKIDVDDDDMSFADSDFIKDLNIKNLGENF